MQQLSAQALADWLADAGRQPPRLLDVREDWEVELCSLPGIHHLPMQQIPSSLDELERDGEWVVICHHGVRSAQVAMFLERQGFQAVYNLTGGVEAWATEVDSSMRRY
jgi:rhodanese-related sulfurtransferase